MKKNIIFCTRRSFRVSNNKKHLLIVLGCLLLIFGSIIIYNDSILIFYGDSYEQMYQFYLGGWERFRTNNLNGFDFSLGFGGSLFNYVFWFLTSPFFMLTLFFDKEAMKYLFLILTFLKIMILFCTTKYWIRKLSKNESTILIVSLLFSFSGWIFFYLAYNVFLDGLIFYPLILGLVEVYIKEKKFLCLGLSIGVLGIINYYMLYMFVPFLLLYTLFRYIAINKNNIRFKSFVIDGIKFIFVCVLGILLCSVIIIPMIEIIGSNSRFTDLDVDLFSRISKFDLYKIISSAYIPVTSRLNPNILIDVSKHSFLGWGGGASIYIGAILPQALLLLFFVKDKWNKYILIVFLATISIFAYFFSFYYLFQMAIDSRWFYMFNMVFAMIMVKVLDAYFDNEFSKKQIVVSGSVSLAFFSGLILTSYNMSLSNINLESLKILGVQGMLIIMVVVSLLLKKTKYIVLVIVIDIVFAGNIFVKYNPPINKDIFYMEQLNDDPIKWIKHRDDGFYRILYDGENSGVDLFPANDPFEKNYNGVAFYNTGYNTNQVDYLNRYGGRWSIPQVKGRIESYNLTSIKYLYSYREEPNVPFGFELIYEDHYKIYENKYYIELGFTTDKIINVDTLKSLDFVHQDQLMLDYVVLDEVGNYENENKSNLDYLGAITGEQTRIIELDSPIENVNLYILNFGMPNAQVNLYNDQGLIYSNDFWQYNYIDIPIEGFSVDKIEIINPDFIEGAPDIYLYTKELDIIVEDFQELMSNSFKNTNVNGNKISSTIEVKNNRNFIYTSIAYDEGWNLKVNGKNIEYQKANMGFIGFYLEEGVHNVELTYQIENLNIGIIISLSSLTLLVVFHFIERKYNKS